MDFDIFCDREYEREREGENGRNFEKSRMINRSRILIVNDKIMSVEKQIRGFSEFIYVTWIYFVMENIKERERKWKEFRKIVF